MSMSRICLSDSAPQLKMLVDDIYSRTTFL
jgi:hypothetical protein